MLLAKPFNAHIHTVTRLQEDLRLHAHADAGRCAGRDHITRIKPHELGDIMDDMGNTEDHRLGIAGLDALAIKVEPHRQILHVLDFILRDEPRTERAECRAPLAFHPLATTFRLEFPLRNIVADTIARDVIERVLLVDIQRRLADDDGELDLPVGFL